MAEEPPKEPAEAAKPGETALATATATDPTAPPAEPEKPAPRALEWAVAVALMAFLAMIFWSVIAFMRG